MLKKGLLVLFFLVLGHGLAEAGREVVAVQSIRVGPYEQAIRGFQKACGCRIRRLVISEWGRREVLREIKRTRPDMVLAVGRDALSMVKGLRRLPIVYLMVLNPETLLSAQENISGVRMNISPDMQLRALLNAMPRAERIGLVYDPNRTGPFLQEARDAATRMGLVLVAKRAYRAKDVPSQILGMKQAIDVFWMVPDITVITPETVEFLILFSLENNIPLLTFSEKYLELGAFMSTGIDPFDMGVQAAEMAGKILRGKEKGPARQVHARRIVVSTNLMIAGKLGIHLSMAGTTGTDLQEKIIRNALQVN